MKTHHLPARGPVSAGRHQLWEEKIHDSYRRSAKLRQPAACTGCGAVYRQGRWVRHPDEDAPAGNTLCPACLRLRVALKEAELAAVNQGVIMTAPLYDTLLQWVDRHYRDRLGEADLADPQLLLDIPDPNAQDTFDASRPDLAPADQPQQRHVVAVTQIALGLGGSEGKQRRCRRRHRQPRQQPQ